MVFKLFLFVCLIGVVTSQLNLNITSLLSYPFDCKLRDDLDVSQTKIHYTNYESNMSATYNISTAIAHIVNRTDFNPTQSIFGFLIGFNTDMDSKTVQNNNRSVSSYKFNGMKAIEITFDYSLYTNGRNLLEELNLLGTYLRAYSYTPSLGQVIGDFFYNLQGYVKKENLYLYGHSLGGQILGLAAQRCANLGKPLAFIFGIDPAGPGFTSEKCRSYHIQKNQADVVTIAHCNAGQLGTPLNLADFNVYFNNGANQKGCSTVDFSCSHSKCVPIMGETLISDVWEGTKCESYDRFKNGSCANNEKIEVALDDVTVGSPGIYYVDPYTPLTFDSK